MRGLFGKRSRRKGTARKCRKVRRTNKQKKAKKKRLKQKLNEFQEKQATLIANELKILRPSKSGEVKLELITILKKFVEIKGVYQHIEETISDNRNQDLITYSKQSIMLSALALFLFRMASGNNYDVITHDDDEKYSKTNMAKWIGAPEDRVPVIKTIEKFLKNLDEKSVNDLMIAFFQSLQKSKFFHQHPQIMPSHFFLLSADCVHTHTYNQPHHTDEHGNNDCNCCLKRVYDKGTENKKTRWLHHTLVFCFVFMGGLKIPIYHYPIHAKQVVNVESASEDKHKQECELVALKVALPMIRQAFPKMKIVLLLDGLYANRPMIRLAKDHRCEYIIVRKDGCLTSLGEDCDGQAKLANHKKNYTKRSQTPHRGDFIERKYEWFNSVDIGEGVEDLTTNVLRFWETRTKDGETKSYKCEWLFSWKLSATTCESSARQARTRWQEEDVFNTLKNRGFNLKHDYSRDPSSIFNWQGLALFSFAIFELFRFSEAVKRRGAWPQKTLANKLLGQLLYKPTEELFSTQCLSVRIQFRYNFAAEIAKHTEIPKETQASTKAIE